MTNKKKKTQNMYLKTNMQNNKHILNLQNPSSFGTYIDPLALGPALNSPMDPKQQAALLQMFLQKLGPQSQQFLNQMGISSNPKVKYQRNPNLKDFELMKNKLKRDDFSLIDNHVIDKINGIGVGTDDGGFISKNWTWVIFLTLYRIVLNQIQIINYYNDTKYSLSVRFCDKNFRPLSKNLLNQSLQYLYQTQTIQRPFVYFTNFESDGFKVCFGYEFECENKTSVDFSPKSDITISVALTLIVRFDSDIIYRNGIKYSPLIISMSGLVLIDGSLQMTMPITQTQVKHYPDEALKASNFNETMTSEKYFTPVIKEILKDVHNDMLDFLIEKLKRENRQYLIDSCYLSFRKV